MVLPYRLRTVVGTSDGSGWRIANMFTGPASPNSVTTAPPVPGDGPTVHLHVHADGLVAVHGLLFVVSIQNDASPHCVAAVDAVQGVLSL